MQGVVQIYRGSGLANARTRNRGREDLGPYTRFFTNVCQISGQSVADVDHGRSKPSLTEETAHRKTRNRSKMMREFRRTDFFSRAQRGQGRR